MPKKKDVAYDFTNLPDNPSFVKELDYEGLSALSDNIRERIIEVTSEYGGHLASNLGTVELIISLYRAFDFPKDRLIFDVGHQAYTHKLLTGRSLDGLGTKDHTKPFLSRNESIYDCFEAGHAGTAMSAVVSFAIDRDLKKEDREIVALIGDSSIVNGLSFEALNHFPTLKSKAIIVINDNDMSISAPVGGLGDFFRQISTSKTYLKAKARYQKGADRRKKDNWFDTWAYSVKTRAKSMLVPTTIFDNMGYTYIGPVDGHSFRALEKAFEKAKRTNKPAVVHVVTQKGRGYGPAEEDRTGYWHGVTPFNKEDGTPKNQHPGLVSWSHFYGDLVHEHMKRSDAILVCPAMIKGSHLEDSFHDYPNRCFDVGIAEEHALTMAGTLGSLGYKPIVSIYSSFLQRAYDELLHDAARISSPVLLLIDRAGLVGMNGDTHQGIYDPAFLASIPGVRLAEASTPAIARFLMKEGMNDTKGPYAIRYPHVMLDPDNKDDRLPESGEALFLRGGKKGAVVAVGQKGRELMGRLHDLDVAFVDPVYLFPIGSKTIEKLKESSRIFVYDPDGTKEGFAAMLMLALAEGGYSGRFEIVACASDYIPSMGVAEQMVEGGCDLDTAERKAKEFFAD